MPRAVRRDAARNATRLREAARQVFAERGAHAPLDAVAAAAGVSIGALYNHFPSRAALLADVVPEAARAQTARITAAVAAAGPHPADRLAAYLRAVLQVQAEDALLGDVLAGEVEVPGAAADHCRAVVEDGRRLHAEWAASLPAPPLLDHPAMAALLGADAQLRRGTPPAGWDAVLAFAVATVTRG